MSAPSGLASSQPSRCVSTISLSSGSPISGTAIVGRGPDASMRTFHHAPSGSAAMLRPSGPSQSRTRESLDERRLRAEDHRIRRQDVGGRRHGQVEHRAEHDAPRADPSTGLRRLRGPRRDVPPPAPARRPPRASRAGRRPPAAPTPAGRAPPNAACGQAGPAGSRGARRPSPRPARRTAARAPDRRRRAQPTSRPPRLSGFHGPPGGGKSVSAGPVAAMLRDRLHAAADPHPDWRGGVHLTLNGKSVRP